jgi:hypothetical protein
MDNGLQKELAGFLNAAGIEGLLLGEKLSTQIYGKR